MGNKSERNLMEPKNTKGSRATVSPSGTVLAAPPPTSNVIVSDAAREFKCPEKKMHCSYAARL